MNFASFLIYNRSVAFERTIDYFCSTMTFKPLSITAIALLGYTLALAQQDSLKINAGNFQLSKHFTQHTTISGTELEKIPFSSLDEAINVYFNGAYTSAGNIVYVIDGNMGADVNSYSIHDIREITLVNDARAVANGARNGKQLIVVETKAGFERKSGYTVAVSEHLVKDSATSMYHSGYASGTFISKKIDVGVSLNYLHDAFPIEAELKNPDGTLNRYNRISVNGWSNVRLGRSLLTVRMNLTPADSARKNSFTDAYFTSYNEKNKSRILTFYPSATLTSKIGSNFYNELSAAYIGYTLKSKYHSGAEAYYGIKETDVKYSGDDNMIVLREQFGFEKQSRGWTFNPSINVTGRLHKIKSKQEYWRGFQGISYAAELWSNLLKRNEILLTPAVSVSKADLFSVEGGLQYRSGDSTNKSKLNENLYPFASVALDLAKFFNETSSFSLLLHGSHTTYKSDLSNYVNVPLHLYFLRGDVIVDTTIGGEGFGVAYKPYRATDVGITFKLNKYLQASYTFERQSYHINLLETFFSPGSGFPPISVLTEAGTKFSAHRWSININTSTDLIFKFRSAISLFNIQSTVNYPHPDMRLKEVLYKGYYPKNGWSGGFTNNFSYKQLSAGINALYYFDEHDWVTERDEYLAYKAVLHKRNSFLIQHVYLAYQLKNANIFASARNLFGSDNRSFINGTRKYFGAGTKIEL